MNCDEFLDLLLENKDLDADADVHMSHCGRCRSMVDVLAPLNDLRVDGFAQSFNVDFSQQPSSNSVEIASSVAESLRSSVASQHAGAEQFEKRPEIWKCVAAFFAGVAACLFGLAVVESAPPSVQPATCLRHEDVGTRMSKKQLVHACVTCHFSESETHGVTMNSALDRIDFANHFYSSILLSRSSIRSRYEVAFDAEFPRC